MSPVDGFVLLLVGAAAAASVLLLVRAQTVLMGWTLLFVFNVASASLSAFVFGRLSGLDETWITQNHIVVLEYSAWALVAMVLALWFAWKPLIPKRGRRSTSVQHRLRVPLWVNPTFIYSSLMLGLAGALASSIVGRTPTLSTIVAAFSGWSKIAVILAAIYWRTHRRATPLVVSLCVFSPLALFSSVVSGFSPVSTDLVIPLVLVLAAYGRVSAFSFLKIGVAGVLLAQLMFAWMISRVPLRKGELLEFSVTVRVQKLLTSLSENFSWSNLTAYSTQSLLLERIDMSDLLAQQAAYQPSIEPFQYGGTLVDGAVALVPRFLWPGKPSIAGGSKFVSRFTGRRRGEADDTSVGVPVQFELFANGGALWVAGGLFLLTYLCARIELLIMAEKVSLRVLLTGIMTLMSFGTGIQQIMLVLASTLGGAGAIYLGAVLIERLAPTFHMRLMGVSRRASPGPGRGSMTRRDLAQLRRPLLDGGGIASESS